MTASFLLQGETQTCALAARLAGQIKKPTVLCLDGAVGAGKSTFARAFLEAKGAAGDIPSPTFTLVQVYDGLGPAGRAIWHMDAYRITDPVEALELGIEEAFDEAICLIEWPGKIAALLPEHRLDLYFSRVEGDDQARSLTIEGALLDTLTL